MKIDELRTLIKDYNREELEYVIAQLYKAIPKSVKEEYQVDGIINNPKKADAKTPSGPRKPKEVIGIYDIDQDILEFIDNAKKQYYFRPNNVVPKDERPKWRFEVKKWYKQLIEASRNEEDIPYIAETAEKLYVLLCYACGRYVFSGDDVFNSIGIEQEDFYRMVLELKFKHQTKPEFIKNGIILITDNNLGSNTCASDLMRTLLSLLPVPDLKYMAIEAAREALRSLRKNPPKVKDFHDRYRHERNQNTLAELIFRCYADLREFDQAVSSFKQNYTKDDNDVALYVLVSLLSEYEMSRLIVDEITIAQNEGVKPRDRLLRLKEEIINNGTLPDRF